MSTTVTHLGMYMYMYRGYQLPVCQEEEIHVRHVLYVVL